jgi:hypothetical protein
MLTNTPPFAGGGGDAADGSIDYTNLVRCFGYGVPNLQACCQALTIR